MQPNLQEHKMKADVLADFFPLVFTIESTRNMPVLGKQTEIEINDIQFTEEAIWKIILKLNSSKSPGPDCINNRPLV